MEIAKWLRACTTGFLVLSFDSPAEDCSLPSVVLLSVGKKKTKGLQSYGCHSVFVSLCFLLSVSQSVSEFWCPKKVVECIMLCHQKRKRNFFFPPVKHYMSYLNSIGGRWFRILLNHWAHGIFWDPLPWKGNVWAKDCFFFLLSNVNILVFEFLNHFNIIWAFTLYFYKHIHTQP